MALRWKTHSVPGAQTDIDIMLNATRNDLISKKYTNLKWKKPRVNM